jgi:hypothetical protein
MTRVSQHDLETKNWKMKMSGGLKLIIGYSGNDVKTEE